MRIALLQINPTAGDLNGNSALIARGVRATGSQAADLVGMARQTMARKAKELEIGS